MTKIDPKYEKDLRFAPADENMSEEELEARAHNQAHAAISGGSPRRERSEMGYPAEK